MRKYILLFLSIAFPLLVLFVYGFIYKANVVDYGECSLYRLTGFDCPGCGGQRMFSGLLHGQLGVAARNNLLALVAIPFAVYFYYCCVQLLIMKNKKYENSFVFNPKLWFFILGLTVAFWILRNIPFEPFVYLNSHYIS